MFQLPRRNFLKRSLALPFLGKLRAQPTPPVQTAPDAALLNTKAGLDEFVTEKYHDQIAAILAQWRTNLVESLSTVLAPSFLGTSPQPVESRIVRPGPALEVRRVKFSEQPTLGRDAFLRQLRSSLGAFSAIHTADFQVTRIHLQPGSGLQTRVRYELVGSGQGFHREQRIGWWDLEWEPAPSNQFRLRRWLSS